MGSTTCSGRQTRAASVRAPPTALIGALGGAACVVFPDVAPWPMLRRLPPRRTGRRPGAQPAGVWTTGVSRFASAASHTTLLAPVRGCSNTAHARPCCSAGPGSPTSRSASALRHADTCAISRPVPQDDSSTDCAVRQSARPEQSRRLRARASVPSAAARATKNARPEPSPRSPASPPPHSSPPWDARAASSTTTSPHATRTG